MYMYVVCSIQIARHRVWNEIHTWTQIYSITARWYWGMAVNSPTQTGEVTFFNLTEKQDVATVILSGCIDTLFLAHQTDTSTHLLVRMSVTPHSLYPYLLLHMPTSARIRNSRHQPAHSFVCRICLCLAVHPCMSGYLIIHIWNCPPWDGVACKYGNYLLTTRRAVTATCSSNAVNLSKLPCLVSTDWDEGRPVEADITGGALPRGRRNLVHRSPSQWIWGPAWWCRGQELLKQERDNRHLRSCFFHSKPSKCMAACRCNCASVWYYRDVS